MVSLPVSLKRRRRREREALLSRLESASLFLSAGYDLSYAWGHGRLALELESEAKGAEDPVCRLWFGALKDLYAQGAPVQPLVQAFADYLRKERARDIETFSRELPARVSLLLLLFFLPAALLLLFTPLLLQLGQAFSP